MQTNEGPQLPMPFSPDWGESGALVWQLVDAANEGALLETVEAWLADETRYALPVLFSLSLLRDVLRAGGAATVRDSQLMVTWPDWQGTEGKGYAQRALEGARDLRPLTAMELTRIREMFAPDLDGEQMALVLAEARFHLVSASDRHPSGVPYNEAFGAALRHWTMPYRGRSGRMKRFMLLAEHPLLGKWPVIAAILELGDEAPFCTWRDELLGLSPTSFSDWLRTTDVPRTAAAIADHLAALRQCLRPTADGLDLSAGAPEEIVFDRDRLEEASHGRSLVNEDERDLLKDRKRLAYGLRLARGEVALHRIARGAHLDAKDADLNAGIRAVHDLVLPRVHLEATVCGAVPPFSDGLGGKLITSFLAHPAVVRATQGAESELLGWSFDLDRLAPLLPGHGLLCLTTKGLYSGHAAIYNRAEVPGANTPLRMRHLANTGGATTTLVSNSTTKFARALLEAKDSNARVISSVYGSGGSKRHRAIEAATMFVGLPSRFAMAGIRRPVYGVEFVSNAHEVIWFGEQPKWLIDPTDTPESYSARAAELWRKRWLSRAVARVHEYAVMPSLLRTLLGQTTGKAQ